MPADDASAALASLIHATCHDVERGRSGDQQQYHCRRDEENEIVRRGWNLIKADARNVAMSQKRAKAETGPMFQH